MPCPHFSREDNECRLLQEAPEPDEEHADAAPDEPVAREWCLSSDQSYRNCPVLQRYLSDLSP